MAFGAPVQTANSYPAANISLTTTTGNLLVAFCSGAGTLASSTVSGGGTWTAETQYTSTVTAWARIYHCLSATGGSSTFTLGSEPSDAGWAMHEYGVPTGGCTFDAGNGHVDNDTSSFTSGDITPTGSGDELLVAIVADESGGSALTWGSSFTGRVADTNHYHWTADRIVTNPSGSYAATGTRQYNGYMHTVIGAFKAAGGSDISASLSQTLAELTIASTGTVAISSEVAQDLASLSLSATATVSRAGAVTQTLAACA